MACQPEKQLCGCFFGIVATMNPVYEKVVSIKDVDLFVSKYGTKGPEIIFIHGGPDWDHTYFLPYVLALAEHCQLYFYDLRGCGKSTRFGDPTKYQLEYNADDLSELLKALDVRNPTLLGFSYGGRVLLDFIDRYSDQVGKIILASTSVYTDYQSELDSWSEYSERYTPALKQEIEIMLKSDLRWEEKTRKLAEFYMPLMFYEKEDEVKYGPKILETDFSGEWIEAWQKGIMHDGSNKDWSARLNELNIPTLILHGEKDMIFPSSVAKRLNDEVPTSKLVVIPDVRHMPHMEETGEWLKAVGEFVSK